MKIIKIIICILVLLCLISSTKPCIAKQYIEKSVPVTEFDKDVQQALKLLHKDLYSLVEMHDKNMGFISRDINYLLRELDSIEKELDDLKIRLDLWDKKLSDPNKW